ncbi:protein kinase [Kamptonema sp. UHCC 0994]|uniref:protein kinase domain-containing protein n=1 Tax=Kamptonema sp. UHCC 0994 TaxID=3031329 RepID=UPI0023B9ED4C|nr:protein kinase [Kamptonema sp. UHCC 0994]MDF0552517.1 protein kinase [Kamptonema sp. UHCC 0994]
MSYCINPDCKHRQNPDNLECCQDCGTPLLINQRYQLIKPLRPLDPRNSTDIFEVHDRGTKRVMKILNYGNSQLVEMFEREALTLQQLNHPGIPKVEIDGYFTFTPRHSSQTLHCLVMEKIEGQNLEQWLTQNKPISQSLALKWLRQLIEILDAVHQNHFFHRDIKPSNIMLTSQGQLVLIDFGTARGITDTYLSILRGGLNATTVISGGYTPPEQINGKATPQSDFYALGRTFVHLLTGKSPTDLPINPTTGQLIWRDRALQVSPPFADFIDELMAAIPADRPRDITAILRYLTAKNLLVRSLWWLVNSRRFQHRVGLSLTLAILGLGIYRLSFPWIAQHYYEQGLKAQQSQELDQAINYYETALKFNPKDSKIYNNIGLICKAKKDFVCAKTQYEKAIKIDPFNPVARYNLGGIYDDSGNFEQAEIQYQFVMQSDRDVAANAASNSARLKILQGDSEAAIKFSLQGLQKTNQIQVQSALYKNLGWARFMQTDYAQAEADLRRAIQLDSKRTDAYCLLAQVLEVRGDKKSALAAWKSCLDDSDSPYRLEVKIWQTMAIQRINETR